LAGRNDIDFTYSSGGCSTTTRLVFEKRGSAGDTVEAESLTRA